MDAIVKRKPVIYFAGKIAPHGWRDAIVGYRAGSEEPDRLFDPELTLDAGKFLYGGPFFISCDHGCAHGRGLHASAAGACDGEVYDLLTRRTQIWEANRERIKRADGVFAYINETDCHGTLIEIGFAAALGKTVHVVFGRAVKLEDFDDMWMAREAAAPYPHGFCRHPWYGVVGEPRECFDRFLQSAWWPTPESAPAHPLEISLKK
jgi:Nucleoside 2-deoxyribosyltransferase